MGKAFSTHGTDTFWSDNLTGRYLLEDRGVDGRIKHTGKTLPPFYL
jgi:hypothetical protein